MPSGAAWPCRHSSWKITGMPRRLFSMKNFWMALVSSAWPRAPLPPPASLGRPTWPRPLPSANAARGLGRIEVRRLRRPACRPSAARRTSSARPSLRASCAREDRRRAPPRAARDCDIEARPAQCRRRPRERISHVSHESPTTRITAVSARATQGSALCLDQTTGPDPGSRLSTPGSADTWARRSRRRSATAESDEART